MAVKIKLMRMGKIRAPYYRIVVADARTKRDGRAIEQIGKYHPKQEPSLIEIDSERAQHWLSRGAQPTDPVMNLLKVTGDWQKFRGETGSEGTLKTAAARPDKKEAFAAALKDVHGESTAEASRPKTRGKKADADTKTDKASGDKAAGDKASGDKASGDKASDKGRSDKASEKAGKPADKGGKDAQDAKAEGDSAAEAPEGAASKAGSTQAKAGRTEGKKDKKADADGKENAAAGKSSNGG